MSKLKCQIPFLYKKWKWLSFKDNKVLILFLCFGLASVFANYSYSQNAIKGTVTDESGVPLPGVNIIEKGTTNGTTTDFEGNFNLTVSNNSSVMVFYYLGYKAKEVLVGPESTINVKMVSDEQQLDQVMVIGYGTKRKSELTNAVVQVDGDVAKKVPTLNSANALQGQLAGLNITQTSNTPGSDNPIINIRGANTFGNNSALIVIDGVPNADPEGLNRINPNDIESISVLKDASAAIYGVQSAGGVILVTTKRGNTGKTQFNLVTSNGFQTATNLPRMAKASSFMRALNNKNLLEGTSIIYSDEQIAQFESGEKKGTDWLESILASSINQEKYDLTVSGGSEKARYFVSGSYGSQGSPLVNDDKFKLNQGNFRTNLDVNVFEGFEVGVDLSARTKQTYTSAYGPGGQVAASLDFNPTLPAFIDGDINKPTNGDGSLSPIAVALGDGFEKYDSRLFNGKLSMKYLIPNAGGLYVSAFTSLISGSDFIKRFVTPYDFYSKNEATEEIIKNETVLVGGFVNGLYENWAQSFRATFHGELGYNHVFNEIHKVSAFVAYEDMTFKVNSTLAARNKYNSYAIPELFAGVSNSQFYQTDGYSNAQAYQTFMSRLTYDYKNKYLFSFNFRADGSPNFAPEYRWGYFPGASVGWVVSNEDFFPKSFLNKLKLRASWGQLGNDRVPTFQYLSSFNITKGANINNSDSQGITPGSTANPNITWEVSTNIDLGAEMGFFNNKLFVEFDYFRVNTDNILAKRNFSVPDYTGLILPDENIGTMINKGFELQVLYRDNIGSKFSHSIGANFSLSKNKITFFDETPNADPNVEAYQRLTGSPLGSPLMLHAIGIYKTDEEAQTGATYPAARAGYLKYEDKNNDGVINSNDMYRKALKPEVNYGLQYTANYGGFDLTLYFTGRQGDYWQFGNDFGQTRGNNLQYSAVNSFSADNPNAELPKSGQNSIGMLSDFNLQTISWFRLKTLNLGYNFQDKEMLSKLKITNLRFYASADNVMMLFNNISKYGAGDPELRGNKSFVDPASRSGSLVNPDLINSGFSGYPLMSTLTFGIDLTF